VERLLVAIRAENSKQRFTSEGFQWLGGAPAAEVSPANE